MCGSDILVRLGGRGARRTRAVVVPKLLHRFILPSEFPVQLRQRSFKHLPMPRVTCNLQLLQNVLPRKFNAIPLMLGGNLLRAQRRLRRALVRGKLLLLLLDRLALPSPRHIVIVVSHRHPQTSRMRPRTPDLRKKLVNRQNLRDRAHLQQKNGNKNSLNMAQLPISN